MLTDRELQTLRNMGNEAEEAADEIVRLRAALAATPAPAPLTLDEVIALAAVEFHSKHWQAIERLIRAVEKHHGIGASEGEKK